MGKKFADMDDKEKAAYKEGRKDGVIISAIWVLFIISIQIVIYFSGRIYAWIN